MTPESRVLTLGETVRCRESEGWKGGVVPESEVLHQSSEGQEDSEMTETREGCCE